MNVNIKRPNITQYYFDFEPCDEIHTSCMWARINLDHDTFTMTATSDCGDYSYSWHVTKTESFTHLMARLDSEYLLSKISDRSIFCFDESKAELLELTRDCELTDDAIEECTEIEQCGEEMFFRTVADIGAFDFESIPVIKKYPAGAIAFARVFTEYLRPLLRKELSGGDTDAR